MSASRPRFRARGERSARNSTGFGDCRFQHIGVTVNWRRLAEFRQANLLRQTVGLRRLQHWLPSLAAALLSAFGAPAQAAGLAVTPIPITLSPKQPSALAKIESENDTSTGFQIQTFSWSQTADGEMQLTPTADIAAFPALLTIESNGRRNVRVGAVQPIGGTERSYRIAVQQLPPPSVPGQSGIQILLRYSIPVFVTPMGAAPEPAISEPRLAAGRFAFAVADSGSAHMVLGTVQITGQDEAANTIFKASAPGGYVLAGGRRDYTAEIAPADCIHSRKILIEAVLTEPDKTVTESLSLPAGVCTGGAVAKTGFVGTALARNAAGGRINAASRR
jgi:fimbrial chaperone protein